MFCASQIPTTPCIVYDAEHIRRSAGLLAPLRARGLKLCYSIKALPLVPILELLAPRVDGFSLSSAFEARLAATVTGGDRHLTSPGLKPQDMDDIGRHCSHVSFNSLGQFRRMHALLPPTVRSGIRVNPEWSWVSDRRFDPCRPYSKLGVTVSALVRAWEGEPDLRHRIDGLHFHTVFAATSFAPLRPTLERLLEGLRPLRPAIRWINLGGGYLFDRPEDLAPLAEVTELLIQGHGIQPVFEPGKALVGRAGYLVSSVIDRIEHWDRPVLVLDSGVHHHPEVFEYQRRPNPGWDEPSAGVSAWLAGSSCLAGDLFGEYRFERLPEIGERIVFADVGAYSLVKASRFNGHNLPEVALWDRGRLQPVKSFGFGEFRGQWTADSD